LPGTDAILVRIPSALRECCGGSRELETEARSVAEALRLLRESHPGLYGSVCDETGAVRRHINLFVNEDHVRDRDGLKTSLSPGDVLTIHPAVSGG
jgi:molybdopterin synthase sulfur carrier subunit